MGEATASLRSAVEELVATRVLAAESALSAALGEQDEADNTQAARRVSAIDNQPREHAIAAARAAALREGEMPTLQAALDAVQAELVNPPYLKLTDLSVTPDPIARLLLAPLRGAHRLRAAPLRGAHRRRAGPLDSRHGLGARRDRGWMRKTAKAIESDSTRTNDNGSESRL